MYQKEDLRKALTKDFERFFSVGILLQKSKP
jgi:hypothetical protein